MGVTARDIREYHDAFSEFDKDRNGSINTSELGNVFRSLGENPTSMELEVRVQQISHSESKTKDVSRKHTEVCHGRPKRDGVKLSKSYGCLAAA